MAGKTGANHIWLKAVVFPMRDSSGDIDEVVVIYEDASFEECARQERTQLHEQLLLSHLLQISTPTNVKLVKKLGATGLKRLLLTQKIPPGHYVYLELADAGSR